MLISKKIVKLLTVLLVVFFVCNFNFVKAESKELKNPELNYVEGEVLIKFSNQKNIKKIINNKKREGFIKTSKTIKNKTLLVKGKNKKTTELLEDLKKQREIIHVQPNYIYHTKAQSTQWGISDNGVQADSAWSNNGITGSGVVVAIIDSGVNYNHEDLINNMWSSSGDVCTIDGSSVACPNHGYDFVNSDDNPVDDHGHGTHVAGIVAAENNSVGVVGVAPDAEIMALKALDTDGSGTTAAIVESINFAKDNNADVINMSIGGYGYDSLESEAVAEAWDAGVVVVSATGNESQILLSYPGAFEKSIAVGAIGERASQANPYEDMDTRLSYFSNYGFTDVVAPGSYVSSTYYSDNSSYETMNGTSMACPHVAGVAALILEKNPSFNANQVKQVLESTATDLGKTGRDQYFGSGLVNADAATTSLSNKIVLSANYTADNEDSSEEPTYYKPILPADSESTLPLKIYITDSTGAFVEGVSVSVLTDLGTLSESSVTTDSNGQASVTLTASENYGTATITADAGDYGTATIEVDMANVLLVSDSREYYFQNNFAWYYDTLLNDLDQKFIRFDTFFGNDSSYFPTSEYLQKFDTVIWYTGDWYVEDEAQTILADFMDNGGNLLITGQDQLLYISDPTSGGFASDTIYSAYLKAVYGDDYASGASSVIGKNTLADESYSLFNVNGGYAYGLGPDYITVNSGGEEIATYGSGESAGVAVNSTYKSVYLPFGVEAIYTKANRESLLTKLLSFFMPIDGVTISNVNSDSSDISWDPYEGDVESYLVSYGTDTLATNLGEITNESTSLSITGLSASTTYYVKIAANLTIGSTTDYSAIQSFTTNLASPTDLKASSQKVKKIELSWTAPEIAPDSYSISYGTDDSASNIGTVALTETNYSFTGLTSNTAYYFKVLSSTNNLNSSYSDIKKIRTKPAKVTNLKIAKKYKKKVKIKWNKVNGSGVQYVIKLMNKKGKKIKLLKTTKKTKTISNLKSGKTYKVKVRAKHKTSSLKGKYSKIKKVTTKN